MTVNFCTTQLLRLTHCRKLIFCPKDGKGAEITLFSRINIRKLLCKDIQKDMEKMESNRDITLRTLLLVE